MIRLINPFTKKELHECSEGLCDDKGKTIPLRNGSYRFVSSKNYVSNFGYQWKKFQKTQIDKFSGLNFSKQRFFNVTNWDKTDLTGKNILEVGSGAGRFTQIVLDYTNANLYSIDYSEAVEANHENNGPNKRLKIFQASVFEMPFPENSFDKVFCFGVLQHTGSPKKAIESMYKVLKPGGELIVDFYPYKGFWTKINAKYILRPFLKNMKEENLLSLIKKNIDWMIKTHKLFKGLKLSFLNRFIPVCDITGTHPLKLNEEEQKEWAVLDTFDMFSPAFDEPLKITNVKKWFVKLQMNNVWGGYVTYHNNLKIAVVKGFK